MAKIAPSILSADFARLGEEIQAVERAGADCIHVDIMDGRFVPNITIGPMVVEAVRRMTTLPLDVHLMILDPDRYLEAFAGAGADMITIHAEAVAHLHRTVERIRELGARPCVSLNPATGLQALDYVLEALDMVLVMTVNPGFGGQSFLPGMLPKITRLQRWIQNRGLGTEIQVDGGINLETISAAAAAGAEVFVAGSAVFHSQDYAETIDLMRRRSQGG